MLNPQITAARGWSATATAAFSGALLVSALTGILVARILDCGGPRAVMTTDSVLGVVAMRAIGAPRVVGLDLLAVPGGLPHVVEERQDRQAEQELACTGFDSQQTDQQPPNGESNLFEPVDRPKGADHGAHGVFDDESHSRSFEATIARHPAAASPSRPASPPQRRPC